MCVTDGEASCATIAPLYSVPSVVYYKHNQSYESTWCV